MTVATAEPAPVYRTGTYEPMAGRAKALIVLLWICVGLAAIGVVSDLMEYSLLGRLERFDFASRSEAVAAAEASDSRQRAIGVVQLGFELLAGIVFIAWFFGMYTNLKAMGRNLKHGTGWAIGGWFVPILNLWRPKQIADEIYRGSDREAGPGDAAWGVRPVPQILHWWWAAWLLSLVVWRASAVMASDATAVDDLKSAAVATTTGDLMTLISGVLAIIVVSMLTERQTKWAATYLNAEAISSQA